MQGKSTGVSKKDGASRRGDRLARRVRRESRLIAFRRPHVCDVRYRHRNGGSSSYGFVCPFVVELPASVLPSPTQPNLARRHLRVK